MNVCTDWTSWWISLIFLVADIITIKARSSTSGDSYRLLHDRKVKSLNESYNLSCISFDVIDSRDKNLILVWEVCEKTVRLFERQWSFVKFLAISGLLGRITSSRIKIKNLHCSNRETGDRAPWYRCSVRIKLLFCTVGLYSDYLIIARHLAK